MPCRPWRRDWTCSSRESRATTSIIIASKRVRMSWFNAGWMLAALLFTCAWWIGLWDLRTTRTWDVGSIAFYFAIAAGIYLQARLVSPRIPERGELDLKAFHTEEGRKYLVAYAILSWITVAVNAFLGQANGIAQWSEQNVVILPMALATSAGSPAVCTTSAICFRTTSVLSIMSTIMLTWL